MIQGFSGVVGSCGTRLILEHENRIISEHLNKNTLWKKMDWHWQQARNEGAHAFTHTDAFSLDTNTFPPFSRIKLLHYAWEPASRHDPPQHNNTCSSEFHYPNHTLCGRTRRGRSEDAEENHTLCLRNTLQDIKDKDPNPNITLCCKKKTADPKETTQTRNFPQVLTINPHFEDVRSADVRCEDVRTADVRCEDVRSADVSCVDDCRCHEDVLSQLLF